MWLQYHQSNLTELFQAALVKLCVENVPFSGNLELDGLFCISSGDISKQIVVKIHKVIQPSSNQGKSRSILKINQAAVDSDESIRQKEVPLVVEVRRGKVDDSIVCRSELSNEVISGTKDSTAGNKKEEKITRTDNMLLVEIPTNSSSAFKKSAPNIVAVNLSKDSPQIHESPSSCRISNIKEEPMLDLSTGDEDSVIDSFQVQDNCGTRNEMKCKHCQVNFTDLNELENHMREVHGRFVCRQCLTTFSLSCNLRRHMKLHTGVRPHVCESCNSSFSRSTDLKIHMKKHSSGKDSFTCSVCSAMFSNSYLLNQHKVKVHCAAEELFRCELCERQFSSESNLKLHQRIHLESCGTRAESMNLTSASCEDDAEAAAADEDDEVSFEDGSDRFGSEYPWSNSKAVPTDRNQPTDDQMECADTEEKQNMPLNFKINHVPNGNTERSFAVLSKTIADNLLETVKEFAPLFSISDSDEAIRSNNRLLSPVHKQPQSFASQGAGKNKRKGMPVKHVKCNENGVCDEMVEDQELSDGQMGINSRASNGEKADNKTLKFSDVMDDVKPASDCKMNRDMLPRDGLMSYKSVDSFLVRRKDVKSNIKSEMHDGSFSPSSDALSLNNNDSESRVFTCRHGGCSTSWFGFGAYESHYVSAHCRYPCELCDQSFTSRNNRRRHANGHGNVKKHTCDRCDKLFARPDIVKEHRITHTQSYQTGQCCKCHFVCGKKTMLLSHLKRCMAADDIDHDINKQ